MKRFNDFINESVRDLMKGKSDDEIKEISKILSPHKKMLYAINNDILWLAEEAIKDGSLIEYLSSYMERTIAFDNIDILKILVNNGVEINSNHLYTAVFNNNIEMVKYLVENGRDLDLNDEHSYEHIFMNLIDNNNIEMVKIILDSKCGVYIEDKWLDKFIENPYERIEIFNMLLKSFPEIKERIKILYHKHKKIINQLNKYI
jgi:hypothetical protein